MKTKELTIFQVSDWSERPDLVSESFVNRAGLWMQELVAYGSSLFG